MRLNFATWGAAYAAGFELIARYDARYFLMRRTLDGRPKTWQRALVHIDAVEIPS